MGEEKIGQGRENAIQFLIDNVDFRNDLEAKIRAKLFPGQVLTKDAPKKAKPAADEKVSVGVPVKEEAKPAAKKAPLPPEELF